MHSKLYEYFNGIKNKRVAFVGLGRSNLPLIKMFSDAGAVVYACDSRDEASLGENASIAKEAGAILSLGENYLDNLQVDILFRTPGMNYNSPVLRQMRANGTQITSEMELFFELCPCRIIAVTGSDGKTTTTTIISELLKEEGYTVHLGGNIGKPLMPEIFEINRDDFAVVELSSFQLISMQKSPSVAVVTNITPNHLDVHKDMQEYIDAKFNILKYQNTMDVSVLNFNNDITRNFAQSLSSEVRFFNSNVPSHNSAYINDDALYYCDNGEVMRVLDTADILIPGAHNVENYLAAITALWGIVSIESIKKVAKSFKGVAHRAELVREVEGVRYYNDSIASSPTRTIKGMLSLFEQKIILICGGYDKNIPYEPLGPVINDKVKTLILIGATALKIEEAVKSAQNYDSSKLKILRADSMMRAVNTAFFESHEGDIVALSPASASFDMYKDFEERGEHFKSLVYSL